MFSLVVYYLWLNLNKKTLIQKERLFKFMLNFGDFGETFKEKKVEFFAAFEDNLISGIEQSSLKSNSAMIDIWFKCLCSTKVCTKRILSCLVTKVLCSFPLLKLVHNLKLFRPKVLIQIFFVTRKQQKYRSEL
ncbi:hypothetical protein BpHYR1_037670 [Brachionus plicatilis]|uniref:Uncharacterized protein n=1 Tax=Brachionus plicatilis TaxID=10195 RepID=A0A3M7P5P2_BRAPC|nr:hypothetical protein BpHYR1_037670 [Brachionus plicatilis]